MSKHPGRAMIDFYGNAYLIGLYAAAGILGIVGAMVFGARK